MAEAVTSPDGDVTPRAVLFHGLKLSLGDDWTLTLLDDEQLPLALAHVGGCVPSHAQVKVTRSEHLLVVEASAHSKLSIQHRVISRGHVFSLTWRLLRAQLDDKFVDTYQWLDYHWYGLGHFFSQRYPLERCQGAGAAVTGESGPLFSSYFGGLQERVVFCSSGVALVVDRQMPLFLDVGSHSRHAVQLRAHGTKPFQKRAFENRVFKYDIFVCGDVRTVWEAVQSECFKTPVDVPCELIFKRPIWSTWAEYKKNIDQDKVLDFADNIRRHQFPCSFLEIDDDWTPHYGDLTFDVTKFPDAQAMMTTLKEKGFSVSLWVHPYVSPLSAAFSEGKKKGFLVRGWLGTTAIYSWWNGYAALIDVTNPQAVHWFLNKLQHLRQTYGVDTFKLDAGEGYQLSPSDITH